VIVGPTAGGKSALAVRVALELDRRGIGSGQIVTADAFQVYRGMDIGTAKPTPDERRGVSHHLIDLIEPTESFSVSQWLGRAESTIGRIRAEGHVPIVVGGTHLYVKALLDGLFDGPPADEQLRAQLAGRDLGDLRQELERVDPPAAQRIHPNDRRRTIRALEVLRLTGTRISDLQVQWDRAGPGREDLVLIGLDWASEAINRRINARVRAMIERGLVDEARALYQGGRLGPQARQALGYRQLVEFFEGRRTLDEAIERIKIETRRFAKNQRTWLGHLRVRAGSMWIDAANTPGDDMVQAIVSTCVAPVPGLGSNVGRSASDS